jgi:hypothetical protein
VNRARGRDSRGGSLATAALRLPVLNPRTVDVRRVGFKTLSRLFDSWDLQRGRINEPYARSARLLDGSAGFGEGRECRPDLEQVAGEPAAAFVLGRLSGVALEQWLQLGAQRVGFRNSVALRIGRFCRPIVSSVSRAEIELVAAHTGLATG